MVHFKWVSYMVCELNLKDTVTKSELVNTCLYIKKIPWGISPIGSVVKEKKVQCNFKRYYSTRWQLWFWTTVSHREFRKSFLPAIWLPIRIFSLTEKMPLITQGGRWWFTLGIKFAPHWKRPRLHMQSVLPTQQVTWSWNLCGETKARNTVPITMTSGARGSSWVTRPCTELWSKDWTVSASFCSISGQRLGEMLPPSGEGLKT